ncbi:MAG: hypothetical protein LBT15_00535 [Synergistaceae bacterium]|nr:hypothetical protein [Synergistaceae bacterium]
MDMRFRMERRIAGIVRWLERCLKACKTGTMESALLDVECARADLESLRNEVWTALERGGAVKARATWPLRAALVAFAVVLATATPLSRLQEEYVRPEPTATLEWVTPDEKALLGSLRRHPGGSDAFAAAPEPESLSLEGSEPKSPGPTMAKTAVPPATETAAVARARAGRRAPGNETNAGRGMNEEPAAVRQGMDVPYDRIMRLVQTGERALKNERPVITIERPKD